MANTITSFSVGEYNKSGQHVLEVIRAHAKKTDQPMSVVIVEALKHYDRTVLTEEKANVS